MTVQTTGNKVIAVGDGTTNPISFPYKFDANSEISVTALDTSDNSKTLKTLGIDYSLSGAGDAGGGTVTPLSAVPVGTNWIILRTVAQTQETKYPDFGKFPSSSHETRS
jgi:hypothetical protein